MSEDANDNEQPVELPLDGTLDLHTFAPRDVPSVVREYVSACREKGVLAVRIIHGKGKGVQRQIVLRVLEQHPDVLRVKPDPTNLGATLADLKPAD